MELPKFIKDLPELDLPFPADKVKSHAIRSDAGLMVIFEVSDDFELPAHSHQAQWGTVIAGEVELTIGGETRTYRPGDCYDIPSGVTHSAKIAAGSKVIDIFAEPDRYSVKS